MAFLGTLDAGIFTLVETVLSGVGALVVGLYGNAFMVYLAILQISIRSLHQERVHSVKCRSTWIRVLFGD